MAGSGYYWVASNVRAPLPHNAVEGGRDSDGVPIYVGLAVHQGEELPAKVLPRKHSAYVCVNGNEVAVTNYKLLVQKSLQWVRNHGGNIPPDAVPAGTTRTREMLYVGRAHHAGSLTVGKVHPSHGVVYIPYGGKEHGYKDYEILVYR